MKLVTKLLTRLSKFIAVLLVFFFDVHIEFAKIETTRTFAQEAVRTTSPGKRAGADPVKLTQEEATPVSPSTAPSPAWNGRPPPA